jgi:hypothetical protein
VEPLNDDLTRQPPLMWTKVDVTARFNAVGTLTALDLPATERVWGLIRFDTAGNYIPNLFLINWNGLFTIPVFTESYNPVKTVDDTGAVSETISFAGADMLALLANRIAYRDPTLSWAAQTPGTTTLTGIAETVIKQLVTGNLVTAGDTARRVPHFTVATDLARGGTATYKIVIKAAGTETETDIAATIGQSVMDANRAIAQQSPIGVRVDLAGTGLVFDCYLPRDLTGKVVFSERLGNLRGYNLTDSVPTSNTLLMQTGATTGGFVTAAGAGAADAWRRVETYADQTSTTDATQISQAQADALAQGAGAAKLAVTAVDLPRLRYGPDTAGVQGYGLGDTVAVDLRDGVTYTDIVSAVQLVADNTQAAYTETVTPTIGAADTGTSEDTTATALLSARVRALEKKLKAN